MRNILTISIIALLLCWIGLANIANIALAATMQADNSQEKPQFDHWVEKRDMSKYNNYNPPQDVKAVFNETWKQKHPSGVIFDPSKINMKGVAVLNTTKFLPDNMAIAKRSQVQISTLKQSQAKSSTASNDTLASMMASANVFVMQVYYCWYWTQDVWFNNQITIYNAGPSVASGIVIFGSGEDGYGYAAPFYDLAVGAYTTVTVPFKPETYTSVGIKPIIVEVRVDPGQIITDQVRLSTDGIERYNNAAGYLVDPDGGDSLETSDLYHFPLGDGYAIIYEAAQAGDNTYTPYNTAYYTNTYVHYKMIDHYNLSYPPSNYTASDLWIISNDYTGVCDEFATLFTSFERSLGVPTRYYYINMINNSTGVPVGHGISEIWDGTKWVHTDPTWNSFNNTHVYIGAGYSYIRMWRMSDANDSLYSGDPYGDGLLDWWSDFGVRDYLGEPDEYN